MGSTQNLAINHSTINLVLLLMQTHILVYINKEFFTSPLSIFSTSIQKSLNQQKQQNQNLYINTVSLVFKAVFVFKSYLKLSQPRTVPQ